MLILLVKPNSKTYIPPLSYLRGNICIISTFTYATDLTYILPLKTLHIVSHTVKILQKEYQQECSICAHLVNYLLSYNFCL